jgi:hypothetical protein
MRQNGTPYIGGGDDKLFNDLALYFTNNEIDINDPFYLAIPYKLYLYVLSGWLKLVSIFVPYNVENNFQTVLLMLNSFWGGLVAVNLKKIIINAGVYGKLNSIKYALTFYNPFILYYSSVLMREIFLVFLILGAIAMLLSESTIRVKVLTISLCFLGTFFVRPVSALIILLASGFTIFSQIKSTKIKGLILIVLITVGLVVVLPNINIILGRDMSAEAFENLAQHSLEQASENSIGAKLVASNNPVLQLVLPFYILLSPLPPPILSDFSLRALLLSLGSVSWAICLLIYIPFCVSFYKNRKLVQLSNKKFYKYVQLTFILVVLNTFIVGYTSHDPRHLLFAYPLIIPLATGYAKIEYLKRYRLFFYCFLTLTISMILFYLFFKVVLK